MIVSSSKNPSTPRIKISRLYLRKSWQVYRYHCPQVPLSKAIMAVQANWQTTKPTVRERTKFMFNNEHLSDVKFSVRGSDGESETVRLITAHKFVLSIGSPVFEAMFYGELAETKGTIQVPDCDYESLLEFFRFLYSDEVNLSGSNVLRVLYLAKKYIVPSLADKCKDFLQDSLHPSNVFLILTIARKYEEKSLIDRCWKVVDTETEASLKSNGFELIEKSLLEELVSRESIDIREVELFKACNRWATGKCRKQGLATDGERKRRILGEEVIKAIGFPAMTQKEFADVVLDTKILTPDEIITLFKAFSSDLPQSATGFLNTPRHACGVIQRCNRYISMNSCSWSYDGVRYWDEIEFRVDKDINFHGLCLFGSENNTYEIITLEIKDSSNNSTLKSVAGTYSSHLLKCENYDYYGFEVLFNPPANIKKNCRYKIRLLMTGPKSGKGCKGSESVKVTGTGVTFTFLTVNSAKLVTVGQFPELLFSL